MGRKAVEQTSPAYEAFHYRNAIIRDVLPELNEGVYWRVEAVDDKTCNVIKITTEHYEVWLSLLQGYLWPRLPEAPKGMRKSWPIPISAKRLQKTLQYLQWDLANADVMRIYARSRNGTQESIHIEDPVLHGGLY